MLVIGLISGTSADGIDAALVDIASDPAAASRLDVQTVGWLTLSYPPRLRETLMRIAAGDPIVVGEVCRANFAVAAAFADAALELCRRTGVAPADVSLLGSHGQTVWHDPQSGDVELWQQGSTLQLGQPAMIAERTGITTVADFRPRDMAVGGQGAPLVPLVDYLVYGHPTEGRLLLNLGGIANLTVLPAGCSPEQVRGFDTGPANMLIDAVVSLLSGGRDRYDRDGRLAQRGTAHPEMLKELLREPYYGIAPPKSTGRELFGPAYAQRCVSLGLGYGLNPADIVATVTALTAATVGDAVEQYVLHREPGAYNQMVASGGGVHNLALMGALAQRLGRIGLGLATSDQAYGICADAREAVAFAVLAWLTWHGRPGNVPGVTGAGRAAVLGSITPGVYGTETAPQRARPPL